MNPEVKESDYPQTSSFEADPNKVDLGKESSLWPQLSNQSSDQWREILDRAYRLLSNLPEQLSAFLGEYRSPLVTLGLILGSIVSVKLTLALLDALDDIPLLAPTFELIGFAYVIWFVYRYLWKASSRHELGERINAWKGQILGNKN